jgi:hypothetical protein
MQNSRFHLSLLFVAGAFLRQSCEGFMNSPKPTRTYQQVKSDLALYREWSDDSPEPTLYKRIDAIRNRRVTIPIVILDAILPGQRIHLKSQNPRFQKLVQHAVSGKNPNPEIGIIGFHPHTGNPLGMGVTIPVTKDDVQNIETEGIDAKGKRMFEVRGEPRLDESGSFFLADVEIIDEREEIIPDEFLDRAQELSSTLSELVEEWLILLGENGKIDEEGTRKMFKESGPLPKDLKERAIWIASLVNPVPSLGVCVEVRPAMMACKNDYERITLAVTSIRASIDHLSGKNKLF